MLIDAHHHLWNTAEVRYELIEGVPELLGCFDTAAYSRACENTEVVASICVEAASARADPERETAWLLSETKRVSWPIYIVAYAPVEAEDAGAYLDGLLTRAQGAVVGIRRGFEHDSLDLLQSSQTARGLRQVGSLGLPFDVVISSKMIRDVTRLAERCPDTRFVLDHMGKPRVTANLSAEWFQDVKALASCTNVCCKISGLMTETGGALSSPDLYRPYIEHAVDVFGPDRILFGSDWPVSTLAGTFDEWLRIVGTVIPAHLHSKLFLYNAQRIYSLPDPWHPLKDARPDLESAS